ncbi:iron permease [Lactifluus volemus]|nr:iron permease [Lactifluus volemus]
MAPSSHNPPSLKDSNIAATQTVDGDIHRGVQKDWKFWCIIFSLTISVLLTAVEFTAIGAALPTIVRELKGEQFIWVGSAYTLGSTALVPLCGGLAQGLGAGAITSLVQIIFSDLLTLRERGTFNGLIAVSWAIGGGVGPVIGGSLAQQGQWRWIFYLNLPICALNATLVLLFMRLKTPLATLREKLHKMDIIGNILITGSITSLVIGLTWGGVRFPWSSVHVLAPLVVGFVGMSLFVIYELYLCAPPVVPILLRLEWTGVSGYLQIFIISMVLASLSYWYPVFFEACKERSPTEAGIDLFGLSYGISLIALVAGVVVKVTGKYVIPTYVGWALVIVGAGLLTTLQADSSMAKSIGFQLPVGGGVGIVYAVCLFPILASIPVTQTAPAMALFIFSRNFGCIWGVTVGGTILQNELKKNLPASFLAQFSEGVEIAFATIPVIPTLSSPLRDDVRDTFGDALKVVWQAVLGMSIAGFLFSLGMRQLELHTVIDEDWGRKDSGVAQRSDFEDCPRV